MDNKTYNKEDFTTEILPKGEYQNCIFTNCNFHGCDLSNYKFFDSEFTGCDLSLVKTAQTTLANVAFKGSKLLGWRFENCAEFGLAVSFDNCLLDHSSFFKTKLKKSIFKDSQLHEVDFTDCDLTEAVFNNCDLAKAIFRSTNLEKADLRSSYNYAIDPENNKIKKAKFSLAGVPGLLVKYDLKIEI